MVVLLFLRKKAGFWLDFVIAILETTRYTVYCVKEGGERSETI